MANETPQILWVTPSNAVFYAKNIPYSFFQNFWAQNHQRTDQGELLIGMLALGTSRIDSSGRVHMGLMTPGSPGPFESSGSYTFRMYEWIRSMIAAMFVPAMICGILGVLSAFVAPTAAAFFLGLGFVLLVIAVPLAPIVGIITGRSITRNRKAQTTAAMQEIREILRVPEQQMIDELPAIVCDRCRHQIEYDPSIRGARCTHCPRRWQVWRAPTEYPPASHSL